MKLYLILLMFFNITANAQKMNNLLDNQEKNIIKIASYTAQGDLSNLEKTLNLALDKKLTVNQIKEILIHTYAYCGFPRSIRGLQTFMQVVEDRKAKGLVDEEGNSASPIVSNDTKYNRGKHILGELTQTAQPAQLSGYSAFAPTIDVFLKEHLFADIFERDVLNYAQREWVTVSVISSIGDAEPMLKSHLEIALKQNIKPEELQEFIQIISKTAGKKKAKAAEKIVEEVINHYK